MLHDCWFYSAVGMDDFDNGLSWTYDHMSLWGCDIGLQLINQVNDWSHLPLILSGRDHGSWIASQHCDLQLLDN